MSDFDLPLLSPDARPDFTDADSCAEWLRTLPLINVGPSHGRLLGELEELNCLDMQPQERLKVLELMREPVQFVQTEHAKKITNRAIPLVKTEREILINIDALWTAMGHGYARCLQTFCGVDRGLMAGSNLLALSCQRALWCTARRIAEQYKCCRRPGPEDWALLHRLYALAEERGFADERVGHASQNGQSRNSCAEVYAAAVLLDMANPNELSSRQLALTIRWLDRFGAKAHVRKSAADAAAAGDARPIWLNLSGGRGASLAEQPDETQSASLRVLDVTELSRSLRKRITALKSDETPSALGLGEDVPQQLAENLLTHLHKFWCEGRGARAPGRRGAAAKSMLAAGIGGIHYFISGLPFKQPGIAKELSKSQREEIATFGRVATRQDAEYVTLQGYSLETWSVTEESLNGFRLHRESGSGRFLHQQLVALRPSDARNFVLGAVRWMAVDEAYVLDMGVRTIPGVPATIAVRSTGLNAMAEKYVPALLLPAVPALQAPASLILPAGWYKPRRSIEVFQDSPQTMLLTGVLERGSDFERVSFEPV